MRRISLRLGTENFFRDFWNFVCIIVVQVRVLGVDISKGVVDVTMDTDLVKVKCYYRI